MKIIYYIIIGIIVFSCSSQEKMNNKFVGVDYCSYQVGDLRVYFNKDTSKVYKYSSSFHLEKYIEGNLIDVKSVYDTISTRLNIEYKYNEIIDHNINSKCFSEDCQNYKGPKFIINWTYFEVVNTETYFIKFYVSINCQREKEEYFYVGVDSNKEPYKLIFDKDYF